MAQRRMTLTRLKEIYRRQNPPRWGADYEPSILATREEAPPMSSPAQLWSDRLRRYIHVLSRVERSAALLALFHPNLFEMQEQRMLPTELRPHPLEGHPKAVGLNLQQLEGTIAVADRLDLLHAHGWLRHVDPHTGEEHVVPVPMFGDLLLFMVDDLGPYCVNWTIKSTDADFEQSINLRRRIRDPQKDARAARARHAIEELVYLGGGIRTVRVVRTTIAEKLDHNLRTLFIGGACINPLDVGIEQELEDRLRASLITREAPQAILLGIAHRRSCDYQDVRSAFFRQLWQRRVRAELIDDAIFVDRPLRPERTDPLTLYRHLFARET